MVPLTTVQGLPAEKLRGLIGHRPLYLWGTGDVGLDVLVSLRRAGLEPLGFLHTAPSADAISHGLPVLAVDRVLGAAPDGVHPFVVIASLQFRQAAEAACRAAGLAKDRDYLTHLAIPRPVAVIEVAEGQNPGAGFGCFVTRAKSERWMTSRTFQQVLAKLLTDQPQLCHVELSWLGDPLRNPELADIVGHCERYVPCTVNTTLQSNDGLEALLAAHPSRFNVLAYGFGASYQAQMGGASWALFQQNLERLKASLVRENNPPRVVLRYIRTRGEPSDNVEAWKRMLAGSPITLAVETPYVTPYDPVVDYCQRGAPADDAVAAFQRLDWSLDRALALCADDRDQPCLSQRVFPVIGVDLQVGLCHLYEQPTLGVDYLATPWSELLALRHSAAHCSRCQQHGLHRLDLPVLSRRYPNIAPQLFES